MQRTGVIDDVFDNQISLRRGVLAEAISIHVCCETCMCDKAQFPHLKSIQPGGRGFQPAVNS